MSQRPTDPIGSIGWTERTGGVLTARECLTLARPLLRGELSILAGRLAMVLRMHSGRRSSIDPASLVPPDSRLARDAEVAAQDLLTPALLNHSSRAYTWGAADVQRQRQNNLAQRDAAAAEGIQLSDPWKFAMNWGGGVKYLVARQVAANFQFSDNISGVPGYGLPETGRFVSGTYVPAFRPNGLLNNWLISAGFVFQWNDR